jgi:hypothetical protein
MKHSQVIMVIGTLALGLGIFCVSAQAASRKCASENCACEEALRQNTVEALEAFLKKYPHSAQGTSACAALAVPPDGAPGPDSGENAEGVVPNQDNGTASGG